MPARRIVTQDERVDGVESPKPAVITQLPPQGPILWQELHECPEPNQEWFDAWLSRVRLLSCDCSGKLSAMLNLLPPRFDDWFAYSVDLHNHVNETLGKDKWTIEEASQRWPLKNQSSIAITK